MLVQLANITSKISPAIMSFSNCSFDWALVTNKAFRMPDAYADGWFGSVVRSQTYTKYKRVAVKVTV